MKAILVILIFGIVFLAIFAHTNNSRNKSENTNLVDKVYIPIEEEQSFFAENPSSQIRNQIEFWEDKIAIPEPIN